MRRVGSDAKLTSVIAVDDGFLEQIATPAPTLANCQSADAVLASVVEVLAACTSPVEALDRLETLHTDLAQWRERRGLLREGVLGLDKQLREALAAIEPHPSHPGVADAAEKARSSLASIQGILRQIGTDVGRCDSAIGMLEFTRKPLTELAATRSEWTSLEATAGWSNLTGFLTDVTVPASAAARSLSASGDALMKAAPDQVAAAFETIVTDAMRAWAVEHGLLIANDPPAAPTDLRPADFDHTGVAPFGDADRRFIDHLLEGVIREWRASTSKG